MSIFEDQTPVGTEIEVKQEVQPNFLDQLVGDDKKFKTVEDLAKGKAESDKMIKELLDNKSEQDYAKDLLAKLTEKATVAPVTPVTPEDKSTKVEEQTVPKPEDIESLVDGVLSRREQANAVASNLKEVKDHLVKLFGTEAQAKVNAKAAELGVPTSFLDDMAAKSPASFFTLIGEAPVQSKNPPIEGTINTSQLVGTEHDSAYYYKMYKETPKVWKSPAMQKQMVEDKAKLGARFFK